MGRSTNADQLDPQIQATQNRLLRLRQGIEGNASANPLLNPLLTEALAELSIVLEELQVVSEVLHQQNAELLTTRQILEQERQEQKQAEIDRQQILAELQILYHQAPCGYHSLDSEGTFIQINDTELVLLGYEREEIVGQKKFPDLLTPESQLRFQQNFPQFKQRGWVKDLAFQMLRKDGTILPVSLSATAVKDAAGNYLFSRSVVIDISERKSTEAALQFSEEKLRLALGLTGTATWDWHLSSGQVLWSDNMGHLLGLIPSAEPLTYTTWRRCVHPNDIERLEAEVTLHLQNQTLYDAEYRVVYPDGSLHWLLSKGQGVYDATGQAVRMVGITLDITDRKQLEIDLQLKEEKLRLALDLNQIGSWDWHYSTSVMSWNDYHYRLFGYQPGEVEPLYEHWHDRIYPHDVAKVDQQVTQALATQTDCEVEYRIVRPDGSIRWLLGKGRGIYSETGQLMRMIGVVFDITERKQLELSLQASEAKLSRILNSAIAVIVSFRVWDNRDWEYEYWSAGCEALYGYTASEMRADKHLWLSQVLPADREALLMPLFDTFFLEQNTTAEYRFRHKNGSLRWIASIYASEQIESNCWMVTSVNYDVSDRKFLEQELLQINAELELRVRTRTLELEQALQAAEAASRTKSAFLANMSHELRTPLNAILGFSQLLGLNPALATEQQEQANIINRSGEHLLNLINDILEMSKIESDQTSLTLDNLDLEYLLHHLEGLFRLRAASKGLQFILQRDAAVPLSVQVDENKLHQVLTNLLSNAVKFTQAGKVILRVQMGERQRASRATDPPNSILLRFSVEDTGPGIQPSEQASLFQPFVQTQIGQTAQEGTGLGLSISQEFVHRMGGELSLISTLGQGTTFYFQIPVIPITPHGVLAQPAHPDIIYEQQAGRLELEEQIEELPRECLIILQSLPVDWVMQLQQSARVADEERMLQLLDQLPSTAAFLANRSKAWINEFQLDKLLNLTTVALARFSTLEDSANSSTSNSTSSSASSSTDDSARGDQPGTPSL